MTYVIARNCTCKTYMRVEALTYQAAREVADLFEATHSTGPEHMLIWGRNEQSDPPCPATRLEP